MRRYIVSIHEHYKDGHIWAETIETEASSAHAALSKRKPRAIDVLRGHGRVVKLSMLVEESSE